MKTSDFDYNLPEELIAQSPLPDRSSSRLLVCERTGFSIEHRHFYDIIDYLHPGDVLVLNDTQVIPARLIGLKEKTKAAIELLLLKETSPDQWETLVKPARRIHIGDVVVFGNRDLLAECVSVKDEGIRTFRMNYQGIFLEVLDRLGEMPLPPYIHEKLADKNRYQTVYSKNPGSAAAPTAGLHFTKELLTRIQQKGIEIVPLTLHVGLGTFRPVNVEDVTKHAMHSEYYELSCHSANVLNQAKKEQRRIIAVGTTSTRTLESNHLTFGEFQEHQGFTNIFIYPGFQFRAIDALITNFHLPKSTLVMLVSALASKEIIFHAYEEAIRNRYRFFSFGDSMFITNEILKHSEGNF